MGSPHFPVRRQAYKRVKRRTPLRDVLEHVEALTFGELDLYCELGQSVPFGTEDVPQPFPLPDADRQGEVESLGARAGFGVNSAAGQSGQAAGVRSIHPSLDCFGEGPSLAPVG